MTRILGFLLLVLAMTVMTSCADDNKQASDPNQVSTIPWNRPEKWEGQGPMGGMMPGSH